MVEHFQAKRGKLKPLAWDIPLYLDVNYGFRSARMELIIKSDCSLMYWSSVNLGRKNQRLCPQFIPAIRILWATQTGDSILNSPDLMPRCSNSSKKKAMEA